MTETNIIRKDADIILLSRDGKKHLVKVTGESKKASGLGVVNTGKLVGKPFGTPLEIAGVPFLALSPSVSDRLETLNRKAQIIHAKDGTAIIHQCDIGPGSAVVEAGAGSGALTIMLARAVGKKGQIITYDNRSDFLEFAKKNVQKAGFSCVNFKEGDITNPIEETGMDAFVLDIPNPWDAVETAFKALKPGGYICCYVPNINQAERAAVELAKNPFIEIKTVEIIQREWVVRDGASRPSFEGLGHTGYLTFARKVVEKL